MRIDSMLVVQVDVFDTEPLQRRVAGGAHVVGTAVNYAIDQVVVFDELDPELTRQEHLLAARGDRTAHEPLVGVRAVHVRGVQEVAAQIERPRDRGSGLRLVRGAVERGHPHASQADCRNLGAVRSKCARVHGRAPVDRDELGSPILEGHRESASAPAGHNGETVFPLNLPNMLTVLRIMLVPVLVVALLGNTQEGDVLAAIVFALASATDFVDGYLARSRQSVTTFGKLMDPLADKLLIVAALISLVSLGRLQAWVAMVIIARELAVTVLRMGATQAGVVMPASTFGKIKTCVQIAAILGVIAVRGRPTWLEVLVYVAVAITVASGLDYFFGLRRRLAQAQRSEV